MRYFIRERGRPGRKGASPAVAGAKRFPDCLGDSFVYAVVSRIDDNSTSGGTPVAGKMPALPAGATLPAGNSFVVRTMKTLKGSESKENPTQTEVSTAFRSERYAFVDLLRGAALIVMVETHVINAYLPLENRKNLFFFWLSFINGLVAPSFLFASGFSLMIQAQRRWQDWIRLRAPFWKQIRRLGFILLVAYYIHLPYFGLSKFLSPQGLPFWKAAFQVDVLQCIVVSLLVADLLMLPARKPSRFGAIAALAAAGVIIATPWMWSQDFTGRVPLHLAMFLNPNGRSLFPIFPWMSFVFAGCCVGNFFLSAAERKEDARLMTRLLPLSVAGIAIALILSQASILSYWNKNFYLTSPLYVVIRLCCVLLICAGWYFMEKRLNYVPHPIRLAGQESLLVYCTHLLLIFSVLRRSQVTPYLGRQLGYGSCFVLSAAIAILMILLARIWHEWKIRHPKSSRPLLAVLAIATLAIFLAR
jgi:uncharacterized membrane protein